MTLRRLLLFFVLCGCSSNPKPQSDSFYSNQFKLHPVSSLQFGKKGTLQWQKDKMARRYKTRLLNSWENAKEPNFAGHYYAPAEEGERIGCGLRCSIIFVIEWETGKIFYLGADLFSVTRDSTLMIVRPFSECTASAPTLFFEFNGSSFKSIPYDHNFCK